jgi:hypothetical protein
MKTVKTVKTVGLLCSSLLVMAGPMEANAAVPEPGTPVAAPAPVLVSQPSPGVNLAPMNAEQEARARKVLQNESCNACSAADETVNRTFGEALLRDFLGRRGRDMFDVGGSLRVCPPPPITPSLPKTRVAAPGASAMATPGKSPRP